MELKTIVGKRTTENGQLVRMNKIALEQVKYILRMRRDDTKDVLKRAFGDGDYTNDSLLQKQFKDLAKFNGGIVLKGIGVNMSVNGYRTDSMYGICEDGDVNCIRLVKTDDDGNDRIIKKKVGKVVNEFLQDKSLLCPQAKTFLAETVAQRWKAYASENCEKANELELVVDDDFDAIYDSDNQVGNFHSCMNGCDGINFYKEIDASAASLRNMYGEIVARCVVFNEVFDIDGNKHRYAERQYSTDCDLTLQQQLVNRLYSGKYIDLHKHVGAGCHDKRNVEDKEGVKFTKPLYIKHCFSDGDDCPYMDGFAYYDPDSGKLWNCSYGSIELCETDGVFHEEEQYYCEECGRGGNDEEIHWSDYHNRYVCEDCGVWSETLNDWLSKENSVQVMDEYGNFDDWMPDNWNERHSNHAFYDVDGDYHWECDCCYDDISEEDILYRDSVEFKCLINGTWRIYRTHEDRIGEEIIEIDGDYYDINDCDEVDGVWYPCDQVPETEEETDEELVAC